jgi:hypothetical protein
LSAQALHWASRTLTGGCDEGHGGGPQGAWNGDTVAVREVEVKLCPVHIGIRDGRFEARQQPGRVDAPCHGGLHGGPGLGGAALRERQDERVLCHQAPPPWAQSQ